MIKRIFVTTAPCNPMLRLKYETGMRGEKVSVTNRGIGQQARMGLGWWMEPPFLHASVTPLRQALCCSYSLTHCIKHSYFLSSRAKLSLLHPSQIYEESQWSIRPLCASSSNGTVQMCECLHSLPVVPTSAKHSQGNMQKLEMKAGRNRLFFSCNCWGMSMVSASRALNNSYDSSGHHSVAQWVRWGDLWVWITLFYIWTFDMPIKRREKYLIVNIS